MAEEFALVTGNSADLARFGITDGDLVDIHRLSLTGMEATARGFRAVAYPTPLGSAAAYYPEANELSSLDDLDAHSGTPSFKSIPITLTLHEGDGATVDTPH